jgi:hypothetical protein
MKEMKRDIPRILWTVVRDLSMSHQPTLKQGHGYKVTVQDINLVITS